MRLIEIKPHIVAEYDDVVMVGDITAEVKEIAIDPYTYYGIEHSVNVATTLVDIAGTEYRIVCDDADQTQRKQATAHSASCPAQFYGTILVFGIKSNQDASLTDAEIDLIMSRFTKEGGLEID